MNRTNRITVSPADYIYVIGESDEHVETAGNKHVYDNRPLPPQPSLNTEEGDNIATSQKDTDSLYEELPEVPDMNQEGRQLENRNREGSLGGSVKAESTPHELDSDLYLKPTN